MRVGSGRSRAGGLAGTTAAILAGGLGTRLRSVIGACPKPLARVGGRPFLSLLLDQLGAAGVRQAVLLTGFGADQLRAAFGKDYAGLSLTYSPEPEPRGTGGALRLALPHLRSPNVVLFNGDSYCELDLPDFFRAHRTSGAGLTVALAHVTDCSRFGRVEQDGDRVTAFREKEAGGGAGWINAGVYLLRRELVEEVPPGRAVSLERDLLPGWVRAGRVFGFRTGGRFLDIGTPDSYRGAEEFFRTGAAA